MFIKIQNLTKQDRVIGWMDLRQFEIYIYIYDKERERDRERECRRIYIYIYSNPSNPNNPDKDRPKTSHLSKQSSLTASPHLTKGYQQGLNPEDVARLFASYFDARNKQPNTYVHRCLY